MAFFTDMKRSLTETGKQVAQKTKELSDTVQLKTQLSREKEALNRQYAQIGKKVFEAANEADEEAYTAEFTLISEMLKDHRRASGQALHLRRIYPLSGAVQRLKRPLPSAASAVQRSRRQNRRRTISMLSIPAESSETAGEETTAETCACETVPDEKFETESAETTVNVTEDQE